MPDIVGKIPDFTTDEGAEPIEEVKQPVIPESEKETPSEPPAVEKPDEGVEKPPVADDSETLRQVQGLQAERAKLLKEIQELRGTKREIKQSEIARVETRIDELKEIHPDDVATIDKVLRAKGYITKQEAERMSYEAVKQDELTKFLDRFPEYKPENDPNDLNWSLLQRELSYYKMPEDARRLGDVLERAHKGIIKVPVGPSATAKKRQIEIAGVGSGGAQKSTSKKSLEAWQKEEYRRGGWSEKEIAELEETK
jgi:hypothetical protein